MSPVPSSRCPRATSTPQAVLSLARIGIDRVEGLLSGGFGAWRKSGLPIERSHTLTPVELHEDSVLYQKLDVRERSEFEEGHLEDALHAYVGTLEEQLPGLQLRKEEPIVVACSTGQRSSLATSLLLRHGFQKVANLLGGMSAWKRLDLPLVEGPPSPIVEAVPHEGMGGTAG